MPSDDNEVTFSGDSGVECENFIQQVHSRAWKEGHARDDEWIADFAWMCFKGKALRWYVKLPLETRRDWGLLQPALLERWPSEDDEAQPQTPSTTPAGSSMSNGYVEALPPGNYAIRNVGVKKVLDLAGGPAPGSTIHIYSFHGGPNQIWSFLPGNQGFKIRNGIGTYVGFASGVETVACAAITGNPVGAEWKIKRHDKYYLIVLASDPGLVLDLSEDHSNNGNKIITYPETGESSQGWILEPKP